MNFETFEKKFSKLMEEATKGNVTGVAALTGNPKDDVQKVLMEGIDWLRENAEDLKLAGIFGIYKDDFVFIPTEEKKGEEE